MIFIVLHLILQSLPRIDELINTHPVLNTVHTAKHNPVFNLVSNNPPTLYQLEVTVDKSPFRRFVWRHCENGGF